MLQSNKYQTNMLQKTSKSKNRALNYIAKTRSGTSLLLSLGIVFIITDVSLGVSTLVVSSIRQSSNVNNANKAYYAAEGALERGLYDNLNLGGPGYNNTGTADYTDAQRTTTAPSVFANYKVQGHQPDDKLQYTATGEYGIPTPGTGNAGIDCDSVHPFTTGFFAYTLSDPITFVDASQIPTGTATQYSAQFDAKENPCNWNKMTLGPAGTVTIPLYYTDASGTHSLFTSINDKFTLRIRTACPNEEVMCDPTTRPKLDTGTGDAQYFHDDPIVGWEIDGVDKTSNETYSLLPYLFFKKIPSPGWDYINSSIIIESKINKSSDNVLNEKSFGLDKIGCKGYIREFLLKQDPIFLCNSLSKWSLQNIDKPVLKFTIIHSLDGLDSNNSYAPINVPYLEYQLLTNFSFSPTDAHQTITSEGFSSTFKQVLEIKIPQGSGLLEYVIQQ